jgi:hypothetical protein
MSSTQIIRFWLAVVVVATAATTSTVAFAGSSPSRAVPDWLERYAAAHPFGSTDTSDAHRTSYQSNSVATIADGRSPDTLDAAANSLQILDGRSPDTLDAAAATDVSPVADGRSPDTRDASLAVHAPTATMTVSRSGEFDWTDASIGAIGGFALALALAGALLRTQNNRRKLAA